VSVRATGCVRTWQSYGARASGGDRAGRSPTAAADRRRALAVLDGGHRAVLDADSGVLGRRRRYRAARLGRGDRDTARRPAPRAASSPSTRSSSPAPDRTPSTTCAVPACCWCRACSPGAPEWSTRGSTTRRASLWPTRPSASSGQCCGQTSRRGCPGALLGRSRAAILLAVAMPMSTTDLARALGQSNPAVNEHLSVLRRSGLCHFVAFGPPVLYQRTPLATSIVAASGGTVTEQLA